MTDRMLLDAAASELGKVIGALLDAQATVTPVADVQPSRWITQLQLTGPTNAVLAVGLSAESSATLARNVMMLDSAPADDAIADTLSEVCGQAVGALSQRDDLTGLRLGQCTVSALTPSGTPSCYRVVAGDKFEAVMSLWVETGAAATQSPSPSASAMASAQAAPAPANLEVILDIELPITVRFGETEMTLLALTRLAPGSVIDLGRPPDDPVEVLANGRLIARGEVVVVGGNYGVRIVEVVGQADRLRSVAA